MPHARDVSRLYSISVKTAGVIAIAVFASGASTALNHPSAAVVRAAFRAVAKTPTDPAALNNLLAALPQVTRNEGGALRTYYVFEGDQLLTAAQVRAAVTSHFATRAGSRIASPELLVMNVDGKDAIWPKGQRALTYSVDRRSFPNSNEYNVVVSAMGGATKDWVDACPTCGVTFAHQSQYDAGNDFSKVTFVVRYDPTVTEYIASSFFPNDPPFHRQLTVAPSYFTSQFDRTGVFRHEIGHILGYRHEHIQGIAGCAWEDNQWRRLTPYDAKSVMHYMCGGGGSFDLSLRQSDKQGHQKEYF